MKYQVKIGDRVFEVERSRDEITLDGITIDAEWVGDHSVRIGDRVIDVRGASSDGEAWRLSLGGKPVFVEVLDERSQLARKVASSSGRALGPSAIKAPMPGLVVRIEVEEGQEVEVGQGVAIVEAMKMENELKAGQAGVVARIHVAAGDTVVKDEVLIEFQAPEST